MEANQAFPSPMRTDYNLDLPAALAAFHRFRAAAAILALPAADIFLRPFPPFAFAHRAF